MLPTTVFALIVAKAARMALLSTIPLSIPLLYQYLYLLRKQAMYACVLETGADFLRRCARSAAQPPIFATHPAPRFANRLSRMPVTGRVNGAESVFFLPRSFDHVDEATP